MAALSGDGVTPPGNSHQHTEEVASLSKGQNTGTTIAEIKQIWPGSKSGGKKSGGPSTAGWEGNTKAHVEVDLKKCRNNRKHTVIRAAEGNSENLL